MEPTPVLLRWQAPRLPQASTNTLNPKSTKCIPTSTAKVRGLKLPGPEKELQAKPGPEGNYLLCSLRKGCVPVRSTLSGLMELLFWSKLSPRNAIGSFSPMNQALEHVLRPALGAPYICDSHYLHLCRAVEYSMCSSNRSPSYKTN